MPVMKVGPGRALLYSGIQTYDQKVLATGPIAYWPLWETSGVVAECLVNPAQNGTYSSNVATWPVGAGIGDGNTAPGFDGTNDWIDIDTAAFVASFNTSTGTALIWTRVVNAGIWTDGNPHHAWHIYRGVNDRVQQSKRVTNNNVQQIHKGSGVFAIINNAGHAETDWTCWALTWNVGGNLIAYIGGAQDGPATPGVTAWAGPVVTAQIGSDTAAPTFPWHGWLAHCAFWNRVLAPAEILALATV